MIQRIQSLWLLLAAAFAFLSLKFSFYTGDILVEEVKTLRNLTGIGLEGKTAEGTATETDLISLLLLAATGIIALVSIFLFNNRKSQLRFTIISMVLSIAAIAYLFIRTNDFTGGTFSLSAVFYFVTPVLLFLATRGIYKDEKLVKSMDRLR